MSGSIWSQVWNGHGDGVVSILIRAQSKKQSKIPSIFWCVTAVLFVCSIAGGELFERIVDDNFEHTEPSSVHYMQQILEGIAYMHQQNIVHLDLKPENIVCVDTTGTSIKIIDFGLASRVGMWNKTLLLCLSTSCAS